MNKKQFLTDDKLMAFIIWLGPKLSQENGFNHEYLLNRPKIQCTYYNLFSAYEKYKWKNSNFNETLFQLDDLKQSLVDSLEKGCDELVEKSCIKILKWGGVKKHNDTWLKSQNNLTDYFKRSIEVLNNIENTDIVGLNLRSNAGFTKIYSLIVDDFIIYDSRVSAALCLLIRTFLKEKNIINIPESLNFFFDCGRMGVERNPNDEKYKFRKWNNDQTLHLASNIKANWLLKFVLQNSYSKFNQLNENIQMRALEAALFMIGYKVNKN